MIKLFICFIILCTSSLVSCSYEGWLKANGAEFSQNIEFGFFFQDCGYSARAINSLQPYIDILPEKLDGLPYWTDTELSELKESPVWERANSIIQSRKDAFSTYPLLFPPEEFNQETFDWSIGIIRSRSFGVPLDKGNTKIGEEEEEEEEEALVPLADLLNHKFESASWNFNENLTMTMKTRLNYTTGDQVYNTYGMKTNAQLLLYYGFMVENNPFDTFHFTWKYTSAVPSWKEKLLRKYNLAVESEFVITHSSLLSKDILLYTKIMLLEEELEISTHLLAKQNCNIELQILLVVEDKLNSLLNNYSNLQYKDSDSIRKIWAIKLKEGEILLIERAIKALEEIKTTLDCYTDQDYSWSFFAVLCVTLACIVITIRLLK